MYTIEAIRAFQLALSDVLIQYKPGSEMDGPGLCNMVCHALPYGFRGAANSYLIMRTLLTDTEYRDGLGPAFLMTEARWNFGYLILQFEDNELLEWLNGGVVVIADTQEELVRQASSVSRLLAIAQRPRNRSKARDNKRNQG